MLALRFSAGMQASVTETPANTMYRPSISQRRSYARWVRIAKRANFPIAGPEMVVGVTSERLVVWRTALIRARPRRFAGAIPLSSIQSAGVHRRVFATVLTLLLADGAIVGLETLHGKRLREFASTIPSFNDFKGL
ncbi:MAG TPA: hypothetical protein VH914_08885 [Acidimicrobiia bacterium]|nr:hypothetical protein [Acidimicrobiia bacterium]